MHTLPPWAQVLLGLFCFILLGVLSYGWHALSHLKQDFAETRAELASTTGNLTATEADRNDLVDALSQERAKNDSFQAQIGKITNTVGTLTKLADTDPELLEKYSKVYFLNDNYVPQSLSRIEPSLTLDPSRNYEFLTPALPFLNKLTAAAEKDGVDLRVVSSYRSFGDQANLKSSYAVTYGAGANSFSADQGYSEHQLGTTVDFSTAALGANYTDFAKDDAYAWLTKNAYRYGFVLSYPPGNSYYIYEPWHWRFVGIDLATDLHTSGKYFYQLDSRTIQGYRANMFDR